MKCSQCQWHNPVGATHCVMCRAPLVGSAHNDAPTAPGFTPTFEPTAAPAPSPSIYLATDLSRTLATLIDFAQMLIGAVGWLVLVWDTSLSIWLKLLGALLLLLAPALLDVGPGSLGKRLLKIQVLTTQGKKLSVGMSLLRHLVKYVIHLLLPVVWKLIEARVTGGRHLHDALASTVVIERLPVDPGASHNGAELFHEQLIAQMQTGQATARPPAITHKDLAQVQQKVTTASRVFDGLRNGFAVLLGAVLLWFFAQAIWSLYQESQNPTMSAVSDAKDASKKLTKLLTQRFEQGQSMELDWGDPALAALEAEMGAVFTSVSTEPRGPVVLQIKNGPVAGKHIVLVPEFNLTKKKIKKWQCGSPDIDPTLLPTGCKATLPTLNTPAQ